MRSTPLSHIEQRYAADVHFKQAVDMLEMLVHSLKLTPSEVREAAMYACVRIEMRRPCPRFYISRGGEIVGQF